MTGIKKTKVEFGEAKIVSDCFTNILGKNNYCPKLLRFKCIIIDIDMLVWYETLTCRLKAISEMILELWVLFSQQRNT